MALALLTAAFPAEKRGTAIGMFSAVTGIAVALGPIVGGAIVHGIDWSWIFWVNVPIGLLAIPLVLAQARRELRKRVGLDIPGVALITAAAFGLVWGLVQRQLRRLGQRRGHRVVCVAGVAVGSGVRALGAAGA